MDVIYFDSSSKLFIIFIAYYCPFSVLKHESVSYITIDNSAPSKVLLVGKLHVFVAILSQVASS